MEKLNRPQFADIYEYHLCDALLKLCCLNVDTLTNEELLDKIESGLETCIERRYWIELERDFVCCYGDEVDKLRETIKNLQYLTNIEVGK